MMRLLVITLLCSLSLEAVGQHTAYTGHYTYAFVEDSSVLIPLQGTYAVEYLARGRWWSYTDPRTPVNYAGAPLVLKPLMLVHGAPMQVVEVRRDHMTTDNKLRVVRGADTMIVDLAGNTHMEERMLARTARVGVPRPPVLLPFRAGWYNLSLLDEPNNSALTERFDILWMEQRADVLSHYDTARYVFSLMSDDMRKGPLYIPVMRDPNYARHLLRFPASGPGTYFELYRQDSVGVAEPTISLRVDMPPDGESDRWVDVTDLRFGRYTTYLKWREEQSLFYLDFGW